MRKNKLKNFFLAIALALGVVSFTGCGSDTELICEINNLEYGFVKKQPGMSGPVGEIQQYMDLQIGSTYYLVYNFDGTVNHDNSEKGLYFYGDITLSNLDVVSASFSDINTAKTEPLNFTKPETGEKVTGTRVIFELPSQRDKPRQISIVIELQPISVGKSQINLQFDSEDVYVRNKLGPEKQINVVSVTIQTPILNYDELSQVISWKHVPNADTYLFIKDNELMEYKYKPDEYVEAGQEITLTLDEIGIYSSCRLKIQAMNSKNAQFHASSYSNTVDIRA